MDGWRRPGFSIPGYAAAAARKGHELGTAYQFTAEDRRRAGELGGRPRTDRRLKRRPENPGRREQDKHP